MDYNKHFIEGVGFYKQQNYQRAIECFTEAIAAEENPHYYSERGVAYFHLKRKKQALADLNKALELEPENPYRWSSRAYMRDNLGDTQGAVEDYRQAIKLDPTDAVAHNNLGMLQEKLGYKAKAKEHWAKADDLASQDQLLQEVKEEILEQPKAVETTPSEPVVEDVIPEETPASNQDHLKVMGNVFTSRKVLKEFVRFIGNGFRHKPE